MDPRALDAARTVFDSRGRGATFIEADLFSIPCEDATFDVAFNSGVLEHFTREGRQAALRELSRVTAPGGLVIVAIPNHASWPYRLAYVWLHILKRWPYPDEHKIVDLRQELEASGLTDATRLTIDSETSYRFLSRLSKRAAKVIRKMGLVPAAEGYLAIYTGRVT